MNSLFKAGLEIQSFLQSKNWSFCFIGALAVIRWGEVRITQDIDLCLLTGFGNEEKYINGILAEFESRIPNPSQFALKNRVLLVSASNGVSVDISLSGLSFEEQMVGRATPFSFSPECFLITCLAEDLIVLKAFADRAKDWIDVEGIIVRQELSIDFDYVIEQLTPLCELKEEPEILIKLQDIIMRNQREV